MGTTTISLRFFSNIRCYCSCVWWYYNVNVNVNEEWRGIGCFSLRFQTDCAAIRWSADIGCLLRIWPLPSVLQDLCCFAIRSRSYLGAFIRGDPRRRWYPRSRQWLGKHPGGRRLPTTIRFPSKPFDIYNGHFYIHIIVDSDSVPPLFWCGDIQASTQFFYCFGDRWDCTQWSSFQRRLYGKLSAYRCFFFHNIDGWYAINRFCWEYGVQL